MYELDLLGEAEIPELIRFLAGVFHVPESHRMFLPETLRWKAFGPHPFRPEHRSYVARFNRKIVGHGVMVPGEYQTPLGTVTAHCVIDWAADPEIRGGGVAIYKKIAKLTDIQTGIGGSEASRKILPRMGFKSRHALGIYRRLVNPLKHNIIGKEVDWKTPARIGRDAMRQWQQSGSGAPSALSAEKVSTFPEDGTVPMPKLRNAIVAARTPALLNYAKACPVVTVEGYLLKSSETLVGYCLLSRVAAECRIADLWIEPADDLTRWRGAVALALQLATKGGAPASVVAAGSTVFLRKVLELEGFRWEDDVPLFVLDPGRKLPESSEIHFGLLENDAFYL